MKLSIIATLIGAAFVPFVSTPVFAENTFYLTPYVGYSFSNQITDENGVEIRTESDPPYCIGFRNRHGLGACGGVVC